MDIRVYDKCWSIYDEYMFVTLEKDEHPHVRLLTLYYIYIYKVYTKNVLFILNISFVKCQNIMTNKKC